MNADEQTLIADFLKAADETGHQYLDGADDPVFGFIQRVLANLKNQGKNYGLIFPKIDQAYRRLYDYFDGDGRIFVIYPGDDGPDQLPINPGWTRRLETGGEEVYYEVVDGCQREIVLAFLKVYSHMRSAHAGQAADDDLRETSPPRRPLMSRAIWNGAVLAEAPAERTQLVEGNVYFPPDAIHPEYFKPSNTHTTCPWKGVASYYTIEANGQTNPDAAWYYPETKPEANHVKGFVAFWKGVQVQN